MYYVLTTANEIAKQHKRVEAIKQIRGRKPFACSTGYTRCGGVLFECTQQIKGILNQEFGRDDVDYLLNNAGTGFYTPA